uniref:Uncharacterized protein n=1 Tax=Eptatretus burgeri TaxID=7764 RepID=A0A8C4Q169_EPTBU
MADDNETNEDTNVNLLVVNRPNIVEALLHDPSKAFDEARARGVLSREDCDALAGEKSNADKIRKCLDVVDGKGEECVQIFLNILYNLRDSYPQDLKKELKNFMIIKDYNSSLGECARLEDRFVEPVIVKSKPEIEVEYQEHEMIKPRRKNNVKKIKEDRVSMEDLFKQNGSSLQHVTKVLMFGSPGIGKSMLCRKLVVDWAENDEKIKNQFDFVILLKCRNLNHISTETTLKEIILNEYPSLKEVVVYLMENAFRLLLVLDALDEMKHPLDFNKVCTSPQEANDVGSIIAGLLQGTLLSHGTVLVTTRLMGLQWLHHVHYDPKSTCMAEIVGFSHEKTDNFFQRFFKNEEKAKQVLQHVSENEVLSSLCFNPVFCWITATCLGRYFDSNERSTRDPVPKTMTELFSLYLHLHLEHHGGKSITSSPNSLLSLCRLAFHGVKERKILFSDEDLITFLSEVFLKTEVESFFAALYFLLPECEESVDEVFFSLRFLVCLLVFLFVRVTSQPSFELGS